MCSSFSMPHVSAVRLQPVARCIYRFSSGLALFPTRCFLASFLISVNHSVNTMSVSYQFDFAKIVPFLIRLKYSTNFKLRKRDSFLGISQNILKLASTSTSDPHYSLSSRVILDSAVNIHIISLSLHHLICHFSILRVLL